MLNRLTLVVRPCGSYHANIKKLLKEEHFDHQFGTLKIDNSDTGATEDVVLVTCMDFHDIGVVIRTLDHRIYSNLYLVDANRNIFAYDSHNRKLNPIGLLYQSNVVLQTYNRHITVGDTTYSFWESKA